MSRKYIYPILIILVTIGFYYLEGSIEGNTKGDTKNEEKQHSSFYYLPTSTTDKIIVHDYYTLSYSETHEQAEWVAYELKKEHLSRKEFKRPYFIEDRKVKSMSADWKNYKNSGYDKGHLCPAADRKFSYKAFEETFLTSNITPQNSSFNAGIWNDLEQQVRYWARRYDGVYVVTGGVLTKGLPSIGYEAVSVPEYFYKVIMDTDKSKMIGLLLPAKDSNKKLKEFVVPVDQIERMTGIDFFKSLEDHVEDKLERTNNAAQWKF